jgi:hypothetical protein
MIWRDLIAIVLVVVTVVIHAVGLAVLLRFLMKIQDRLPTRFWPIVWLLIRVTLGLIMMHLAGISVWGIFYYWQECVPDLESALYFSGVTYATIGYGDLLLPKLWRMLSPVEGLTGILMCGLSAGIFFAVLNRIFLAKAEAKQK